MAINLGADDKKKILILAGLLGLFGAVVFVVAKPKGRSTSAVDTGTSNAASVGNTAARPGGPGARPPVPGSGLPGAGGPGLGRPGAGLAGGATSPSGSTSGSSVPDPRLIAAKNFRPDPFTPYYRPALIPPPPPPPPLVLPPLDLPSADGATPVSLGGQPGSGAPLPSMAGLPAVNIPQYKKRSAPSLGAPTVVGNTGTSGGALRASNKRVAGVIIGDSVKALVEISDGQQTITRVVQPGDEVEGMRILRIERITENDAQVTRMTVLENGQERYFDLRPSPNPIGNLPGGGDGLGGMPGGMPGLPGRPGGRVPGGIPGLPAP
jgi:hypothetical protein